MPFSCIKQTDHYYLLHFLNESLFAAIQPLQNLDRLSLSLTTLKNASLALQLLAVIISVRLQSHLAQQTAGP